MGNLTRRQVLKVMGGTVVGLSLGMPACSLGSSSRNASSTGKLLRSKASLPAPFGVPLPIPPVLTPVRRDDTTDYYEITQRAAPATILPGLTTEVWGYNGIFPGPTIESQRGRQVSIRHRNELPVPVVVHLHGAITPPEHDGYPTDLILPVGGWHADHPMAGNTSQDFRDYIYPLDQPAATLWYHDHRMDFTGPQVYRGLAGFHLIHDEAENALPLPKGERDIPLMICDRAFDADGSFLYPSLDSTLRSEPGVTNNYMEGVLGDVILVNGAAWPYLEVSNTRYRFRILNASNARRYRLELDPPPPQGPTFVQIGSDVGLLGQPKNHDRIEIASAERFDVVIDFSQYPVGTQVKLVNTFEDDNIGLIMRFDVVREAADDTSIPVQLVTLEQLSRSDAVVRREFRFTPEGRRDGHQVWTINGRAFDPDRIDAQPELDTVELWRLHTNVHHPVHLHLGHFQVLSREEDGPGSYDAGWKDTIDMQGDETADILVRFNGYRGRYVFHCHNLEHEDMMMMANFEVV